MEGGIFELATQAPLRPDGFALHDWYSGQPGSAVCSWDCRDSFLLVRRCGTFAVTYVWASTPMEGGIFESATQASPCTDGCRVALDTRVRRALPEALATAGTASSGSALAGALHALGGVSRPLAPVVGGLGACLEALRAVPAGSLCTIGYSGPSGSAVSFLWVRSTGSLQ